jgi:uncharacterized protein YqeY
MSLSDTIKADLKEAMRAKDKVRLRTLRMVQAALKDREIAEREGGEATLTEEQQVAVVQKQAKQRRDSIAQYEQAGRDDLAEAEREELAILTDYLPKQLTDDELRAEVEAIVADTGATSMKDMGKVMGRAMGALRGRADGKRVQAAVRSVLSA